MSSLGFVALLATVQALCSLTSQVLEPIVSMRSLYRTKFLDHAIHFIVLRQDVLQHSLAFWMLQSDSVFPSSSCFSCEDQSLLVGMNAFLVFTLVMVSVAFFSHHWNASCCCGGGCNHCCTRICRCDHVKRRCLPLLEDLQIRFAAVFSSITAVILASKLRVL